MLRVLSRILLVVGIAIVLSALYVLSFILGKPKPTVDYLALLNQMTKVEGRAEADNAWPDYQNAFQLQTWDVNDTTLAQVVFSDTARRFMDLNEAQKKAVEVWIERNEDAWRAFMRAATKPYCWREYRPLNLSDLKGDVLISDAPMMRMDIGHSNQFRQLWLLGQWRIRTHLGHGRMQAASDDCLVLIRAGMHWSENKTLIESLMGIAMSKTGYYELLATLAQGSPSGVDLRGLENQLRGIRPCPEKIVDLREERLEFLDFVQHSFTRGGIGGGHLVPESVWPMVAGGSVIINMSPLPSKPSLRQQVLYTAMALLHARRNATLSKYESLYTQMNRIISLTPYQVKTSGLQLAIKRPDILNRQIHFNSFVGESRYFVIGVLLPAISRVGELTYEERTLHDAVLTVLAVKRYQADKGRYPETLEELVQAGYRDYVPPDPYSDKPLVYRKTVGSFILYSVGQNMKDDGGHPAVASNRYERQWGTDTEGDGVLWPPQ